MSIVIIHGPKASGKTTNAERLMRHYGLKRIVEWEGMATAIRGGDLILTCGDPSAIRIPGAKVVGIEDALRDLMRGSA